MFYNKANVLFFMTQSIYMYIKALYAPSTRYTYLHLEAKVDYGSPTMCKNLGFALF